jgi:hypothetical protein
MIWLSVNRDVFMQNFLAVLDEKILPRTTVTQTRDYGMIDPFKPHFLHYEIQFQAGMPVQPRC